MMLDINHKTQEKQALPNNVSHLPRGEMDDIADYLDEVMGQIRRLDYNVEYRADLPKLEITLEEKLPASASRGRTALIEDILQTTTLFFRVSNSDGARVQFGGVDTDMCRLFHVDNVGYRMLCTYRGPGTEWVENSNVWREGIGKGDNSKIVKDFNLVNRAKKFDLLILKGIELLGEAGGAVHRSPPIESTKEKRILLRIDEY